MSPFDGLALDYDARWTNTPGGREQRDAVWKAIDPVFRPGYRVLDLGCGTGIDAIFLQDRGVTVRAIDKAEEMVKLARARGIDAQRLAIEDLHRMQGTFDGALSNFGALNCVEDVGGVAGELGRLLRPGAPLALCMLSRFCWPEVLRGFAQGDWRRATRRWRRRAQWRGIQVYYPTRGSLKAAFTPMFKLERALSLGGGDHWLSIWRRRT